MSGVPERNEFSVVASDSGLRLPGRSETELNDLCFEAGDSSRLNFLNEVVGLLPTSVTVQDEQGNFVFVNAAAAAQFNVPAHDIVEASPGAPLPSKELNDRINLARGVLQSGVRRTFEELIRTDYATKIYLTTHEPVLISNRKLVLSSSIDISRQKAIEEELFRSAYYDELTGLPTRRVIEQHANSLIREGEHPVRFAVAFLDIDNFKHINDYYGHASGDELLIEVARRLGLGLRTTDMLSRISGDEFLLLLNPVQSDAELAEYIEFLLQRLKAPFFIDGSELFASASIGVSIYPDQGDNYEVLRQNADTAMYQIKNETKGGAAIFDSAMQREALLRMEIEQSLRLAILDKRFCCAFQPKVDIKTQQIKGIEALVRLRSDDGIIQAPGTFVDLAIELGLIDELTHLVLAEIMRSIDLIDEAFGSGVSISINVAAKQAGNVVFMTSFARALEKTGCATRFIVEVTEDAFVAKTRFQTEILPVLRRLGVRISIDDFGIGYSSLSALADITADEIKIDRSFIVDIHKRPRSQGILKAIESLGEALGMAVIAEGVEKFEELAYLQAATRIKYAQGFYFSEPVFLEDLVSDRLAASKRPASSDNRPLQENRQVYSRANGYSR
ncbi:MULTISPECIES: EAL domain-containing protein [unclassified Nitrobacter]|uniref:putative bifunctional diguanylate cyclase/phosphodiesterase n=1 Tax=Nitrobacter sp. TaxID=29420 RepID=UPI0003259122|nr:MULTISPECIES: EAL domain-containing protein [unclassified Nitrobacter]MCB1393152.1 EAL domain-containing protein [Nitrobacter sp.]MCV0385995.1 EAL domain-containing protein [Nitrobacter sp.]